MPEAFAIGDRRVGPGEPIYLVAELSGNHSGELERALACVRAAARSGADAIKLQTYRPDTLTIDVDAPHFRVPGDGPWAGRTLHDLYTEAHTPWEWHAPLFEAAHAAGIQIFSTPFDPTAVELLESLGAKAYKIASFELVDDALLRCVAATGKPVILSTGMADLEEIEHALSTLRSGGASALALLRCTSSYPAPDDAMNLHSIGELMRRFDLPVGLSDHSEGTLAPVVSIALGACMVEKHFTLARADGGVDSHFSLEPAELRQLVDDVRRAERMLGEARFGVADAERESSIFRRSLYVVEDVRAGEAFSEANVRSIRPGFGLAPRHLDAVLGRRASRPLARGTPLRWDALESR